MRAPRFTLARRRCKVLRHAKNQQRVISSSQQPVGVTWHLDEVFVTRRGEPYVLRREVDHHDVELDTLPALLPFALM